VTQDFGKMSLEAVRNDNTPRKKKFLNMPNSDYKYSMQLGVFVQEGYHSKYIPSENLYDSKRWSDHKKRQLTDRLSWQELAETEKHLQINRSRESAEQKMISPISHYALNQKFRTLNGCEIFISSLYAKQNNLLPFLI